MSTTKKKEKEEKEEKTKNTKKKEKEERRETRSSYRRGLGDYLFIQDAQIMISSVIAGGIAALIAFHPVSSVNLRSRAEPNHHVGTLNPILDSKQRQCLGETYPSNDDQCGICICETANFENQLLNDGVSEYAQNTESSADKDTWALPQRMEERCLKYLHTLSNGQPTMLIETHHFARSDGPSSTGSATGV